jgi:hypothetical protein
MNIDAGERHIELKVARTGPPGIIEGKVVHRESGQPVAGVQVQLPPVGSGDAPLSSLSQADGSFRITGVAPGTRHPSLAMPSRQPSVWLDVTANGWVDVPAGKTVSGVVFYVAKATTAEVRVVTAYERKPLA